MVIINQTFNVEESVAQDWIKWVQHVYLPEVMATGYFTDNRIMRLLSEDAENGNTYAIQFSMPSATYVRLQHDDIMHRFEEMASRAYGDKVLFFRTVLEVVG